MCDGHIVYQGDAKKSVDYFKLINNPVPRFANPADFFMKLLSINYPKTQADLDKLDHLTRHYHAILEKSIKAEGRLIRLDAPAEKGAEAVHHKATTKVQLQQLMGRSWLMAKRDPRLSRAKLFQTIAVIIFMVPCFWQLNDYDSVESIQSMVGSMYFLTMMQMLFNFLPTVVVFQGEKPIYVRERDSGLVRQRR